MLLEAMVAVLVLAFGILGVVGLQVAMTKAQTSSKFRGDASYLAQQLIGTMWSDRLNLAKYATAQCSTSTSCSDWSGQVAATLPSGTSVVTVNAATGAVTILISWTPPNEGTHTYTTATSITNS